MSAVRYYPVPTALSKLSLTRHAILEASAGTGKTYSIEHLVVALLLETPAKLDDILIVTFTERATAELRARIRGKITAVLQGATPERPAGRTWALDADGEAKLARALSGFDAAPIFTIHGFCKRVLADQAFFSGQLFDQELVDAAATFERAFRAVLRSECTPEKSPARARLLRLFLRDHGADALEKLLFDAYRKRGAFEPQWDADAWSAEFEDQDDAAVIAAFETRPLTLASAVAQEFTAVLRERLEQEKAAQGRMDYDDMLARLRANLEGDGGAALAHTLRTQYKFALIDEFQDTDPDQWHIFRSIFVDGPAPSAQQPAPAHNRRPPSAVREPLFLIGDPKQAIYSFRGADVQTYLEATHELRGSGADEAPISENFRSSREMIDAYNAILSVALSAGPNQQPAPSAQQPADPFFTGGITYDPMVRRGAPEPVVRGAGDRPPVILLHDVASNDAGATAVNRRLAQHIAAEIKDLITRPDKLTIEDRGATKPVGAGDVFILTRSNNESVLVARQLRRAGVPYAFYKQDGLFQTFEAADIRDALAAVAEPADAALRMRAWASPFFGVPWGELAAYRDVPGTHPLFADLLAWHELAKRERFHELFERMLNDSGLIRREIFFEESERARTNYEHIFEVLLQTVSERRCSLAELARLLTRWMAELEAPGGEDGNVQRLETEKDAVQIMTIHRSKGLEAAVVFLFGGVGKPKHNGEVAVYHRHVKSGVKRYIYVGSRSSEARANNPLANEVHQRVTEEAEQEFQRLYYVGLTRAKARLYLPLYGDGCDVDGPYACVHARLRAIAGDLAAAPGARNVRHKYTWRGEARAEQRTADFEVCTFDLPSTRSTRSTGSMNAPWSPPADLLTLEPTAARAAAAKAALGRLRVESFTSLRGAQKRRDESQGGEDEMHGEPVALAAGELPPGTSTGIFLHQALETVDPKTFAGHPDARAWRDGHPAEHLRIQRLCEAFGLPRDKHDHAVELVYRAFTTPLAIGATPLSGMHAAEHLARETDFVIPLPERAHPALGAWGDRVHVSSGYLKGYIDVLFSHEGKIYFADWKSNLLDDYGPESVKRYTERAYGLQGVLYTLGLVRLFGLNEQTYEERFGGYAYLYLRGLDAAGNGLYANRATWAELAVFNGQLAGTLPPRPHTGGIGL